MEAIENPALRHATLAPLTKVESLSRQHFLFSFQAPTIAATARAGQFIHVLPRDSSVSSPLLRRAFSIMAVRDDEVDILFRVEGTGTILLSKKCVGESIDILGPLGQPFDTRLFHVKQPESQEIHNTPFAILVGGGVGVPPLVFLGETLIGEGIKPLMLIGARNGAELIGVGHCQRLGIETRIATDDGSVGITGRVTELLEAELIADTQKGNQQGVVYACGPLPMLKAVAKLTAQFGVACQVSLEENMPCGIGVCNGCVVAVHKSVNAQEEENEQDASDDTGYERYQRICVAGPALWADTVDWESI